MNGTDVIKRLDGLKSDASAHRDQWERMAPFISPSRAGLITSQTPGNRNNRQVFDSTTMMCAKICAQFMAGHIINPSQQWMGWEMRDAVVAEDDQVREWLEECRDIYLKYLGSSLFYAEGPESLIDYVGFGTGCLLQEEATQPTNKTIKGFRGLYFKAEKTGRFYIAEGPDGVVDTLFREFDSTVKKNVEQFGEEACSEKVRNKYKERKLDEVVKMCHAIVPRPSGEQTAGSKGMPWASLWVEYDTKHVCYEGGYRVFPAAVPRWDKTPGEVFGRGLGDLAFPDTWSLNQAKRMGLEDHALKLRPPLFIRHDSVIGGTLKLVPGGPTSVNTHGQRIQDMIMPYETGSRPEVTNIKEEELRKSIRQIFFVEQILALMQVEKSEMTAFEFAKKIELLFRLLGPVYGRLEWEYLYRITEIGFDILLHARAFPPPPPIVQQTSGDISTVFHNPIAKAQRAGDAEAVALTINDLAPLVQVPSIGPSILDYIDPDKTAKGVMGIRGYPSKWTRSEKEVVALRGARQQQQQDQLQTAKAAQYAESAGKVAPLLKVLQGGQGQQ